MKKFSLLVSAAIFTALFFVSCKDADDSSATVEEVKASSVVSAAEDAGIEISADAVAVDSSETFEDEVLPVISTELSTLASNLSSTLSSSANIASYRAAVSEEDLEDAFDELEEDFQAFTEELENSLADGEVNAKVDWKAPTGTLTLTDEAGNEIEGVEAELTALSVSAKVSGTTSVSTTKIDMDLDGKASMKVGTSVAANTKDAFGLDSIPYVKASVGGSATVKAAFDGEIEISALSMPNPLTLLSDDSPLSGSIAAEYGYSAAMLFDTGDYAGIIKADLTLSADASLSAEVIADCVSEIMSASLTGSLTEDFFEALPVDASLVVSVYDTEGEKLFDYINATSLYEAYQAIEEYIPQE
ncbi:MAG: hypothetical protein K5681_01945 [Treponema sp.]|nr:hypothetical protein [Treponema sp.]